MKRDARYSMMRLTLIILAASILGGCGGYARSPNGSSGIETYGVIDVGVQQNSR